MQGPHRNIKIASVCCPPKHNLKATHFVSLFQTLGPCFVVRVAYNSKYTFWGSRLITSKGRELVSVIKSKYYAFLSAGTPMYWPADENKIPDLLNFFIISGLSPSYADIQPSYDLSSDHTRIITSFSTSLINRKPTPRLHN